MIGCGKSQLVPNKILRLAHTVADFTGFHDFPETRPLEDDVREMTGVDPVSVVSVLEVIQGRAKASKPIEAVPYLKLHRVSTR